MAKQDEVKKVPPDAVGKATVETTQPDGVTTVKTVPASEVKAQTAPAPAVPRRATRQTRDQLQRTRRRTSRKGRTMPAPQRAARPLRDTTPQERTITIALPAHQWERMDRLIKRTQRSEGDFFRHLLSPYLR